MTFKIYRTPFDGYFLRFHAVICSVQNEAETFVE